MNFEITSNKGGEADPVTVTTDDAGEARTVWRLGFGIGTHSLSAWADVDGTQLSASFTATAVN